MRFPADGMKRLIGDDERHLYQLGSVVVEKGLIDVEENDAKAVQGPTWPGR